MSDFKITNLINGGARIAEYNSGLMTQSPFRTFEITKEQFDQIRDTLYKIGGEP